MNTNALYKLSGAAAIAGGMCRIVASFNWISDPITLEWFYDAIDALLLFGVIGIYLERATRLGFSGLAAFIVAVAALSFMGGPDADPFGFSTYEQGSYALALAMVALSIVWIRVRERPISPPLCWFGSVIAVGVFSMFPAPFQHYGIIVAGVLFGAGFVTAGTALLTRRA